MPSISRNLLGISFVLFSLLSSSIAFGKAFGDLMVDEARQEKINTLVGTMVESAYRRSNIKVQSPLPLREVLSKAFASEFRRLCTEAQQELGISCGDLNNQAEAFQKEYEKEAKDQKIASPQELEEVALQTPNKLSFIAVIKKLGLSPDRFHVFESQSDSIAAVCSRGEFFYNRALINQYAPLPESKMGIWLHELTHYMKKHVSKLDSRDYYLARINGVVRGVSKKDRAEKVFLKFSRLEEAESDVFLLLQFESKEAVPIVDGMAEYLQNSRKQSEGGASHPFTVLRRELFVIFKELYLADVEANELRLKKLKRRLEDFYSDEEPKSEMKQPRPEEENSD